MNLAAIIEEGERLEREAREWTIRYGDIVMRGSDEEARRVVVGAATALPRLLAVAKAAVEWEQADDEYVNAEPAVQMRRLLYAEAALRAAVRGEEEKKG